MPRSKGGKGVREAGRSFEIASGEEIDLSDIPELDAAWFANAELKVPVAKEPVSIRLDADVLAFFREQGTGYQTRINSVLRAYMEALQKRI